MEHNKDSAQPRHDDSSTGSDAEGMFEVGAEIGERGSSDVRPDVADALDRGVDASTAPVAGDNADVVGDADAMTSGDSADPAPDDTAQRAWGLATDTGTANDDTSPDR